MMNKILFISALFVLGLLNLAIYQKQAILKEGEIILLPLDPVDPRSLMQGDYMTFRYALTREMATTKASPKPHGYAVIKIDADFVGHFARFYQGEKLQSDEKLIKYQFYPQFRLYKIKPDSFLFQEGRQKDFQKAKYAIFHYQGDKNYLLVGLADENFILINEKLR